jgi:hypothetical protein
MMVLGMVSIFVACATASAYEVKIYDDNGVKTSADSISEEIYQKETISVRVINELNESVDVSIDSPVEASVSDFTLSRHSSRTVKFTFNDDVDDSIRYTFYSNNFTKSVNQDVEVDYIRISLEYSGDLKYKIQEMTVKKETVQFRNTGDGEITLNFVSYSEPLIAITPDSLTLSPGETGTVTYVLYGSEGSTTVSIKVRCGDTEKDYTQKITINVEPNELISEMNEEISKYNLEGNIEISVPEDIEVGDTVRVSVNFNGAPLQNGIMLLKPDMDVLLVSSGVAEFTPSEAGKYTLSLLNFKGVEVASKDVEVKKTNYSIYIPDINIGETYSLKLPEDGKVEVVDEDGDTVYSGEGKTHNITITKTGKFTLSFESKSYTGHDVFEVKGAPAILLRQDGKPLQQYVEAKPIEVVATIGDTPVDGKVIVQYPAKAFGYSDKDTWYMMTFQSYMMMMQSYMGSEFKYPMTFIPPNQVMYEYPLVNGVATVPVPDKAAGEVISIMVQCGDEVVFQSAYRVSNPLWFLPYLIIAIVLSVPSLLIIHKKRGISLPLSLSAIKNRIPRRKTDELEL